jgi:hypothetical protein
MMGVVLYNNSQGNVPYPLAFLGKVKLLLGLFPTI